MTHEETKAHELILSIYESRRHMARVSPSWLATEAMNSIDPGRESHPLEYAMAHLQFRQLARGICAGRWEIPETGQTEQHDMFPMLQARYPVRPIAKEEPVYVLLELMTDDDAEFNIERLRSEASAKMKHADALEAWKDSRRIAAE